MARTDNSSSGPRTVASFSRPRDWADLAAVFDMAIRVFAEAVRPVLQNNDNARRLAPSNVLLLVAMESEGRPVRVADLIREGRLIPSNATYALKSLHVSGCIEYAHADDDRRTKLVTLTDIGRQVVAAVRARCAVVSGGEWIASGLEAALNLDMGVRSAGEALGIERPVRKRAPRKSKNPRTLSGEEPTKVTAKAEPKPPAKKDQPKPQRQTPAPEPRKQRTPAAGPAVAPPPAAAKAPSTTKSPATSKTSGKRPRKPVEGQEDLFGDKKGKADAAKSSAPTLPLELGQQQRKPRGG